MKEKIKSILVLTIVTFICSFLIFLVTYLIGGNV